MKEGLICGKIPSAFKRIHSERNVDEEDEQIKVKEDSHSNHYQITNDTQREVLMHMVLDKGVSIRKVRLSLHVFRQLKF